VLGKNRADRETVVEFVKHMLDNFHKINASMTSKLHFLHHHLDEFLKQLSSESDEQGERFHQVTMPMEKRYKGKKLDALIAEVTNITHDADRIVNIVVDPKDDRTFGYSYQPASSNNDGSYQFWAFKTEKPAKNTSIVSALREITREEQETKFLSPNAVDDPLNSKPEELQQTRAEPTSIPVP
ncbi:unnamed protein product, partial [Didymodactylos carnosus]